MKIRGVFLSYACVFILGIMVRLYANTFGEKVQTKGLYCVELKDGIPVLISDGKLIQTEITFPNGTKIKPNGTVTRKDGTQFVLRSGECVNDSAEIAKPVRLAKTKK